MLTSDFHGLSLSRLGFGTMRLPQTADGKIDEDAVFEMVDYALSHGVNYFDTAYPYHDGTSEVVIGRALKRHDRNRFYLADKFPGHQISSDHTPAPLFERQLQKCGVDYFDFYLLHNVCENSIKTYTDRRWKILDYLLEQKSLGRIRHLGFSSHGRPDNLRCFLELYGKHMEFCQIQLNYLDWTLQDAKKKCEILQEYEIPVWVMEPVRGGRLVRLNETESARFAKLCPGHTPAEAAFSYLIGMENVKMILSGMSSIDQMRDNVRIFSEYRPLTETETAHLYELAEAMKGALPCTACRYCTETCPQKLNIPMLISAYNDARFAANFTVSMQLDALPEEKLPSACIGCGLCLKQCPQKIDIPAAMRAFSELIPKLPNWAAICKAREEAQKKIP